MKIEQARKHVHTAPHWTFVEIVKKVSHYHYHFLFYLIIFLFSGMERNVVKDEKDALELFKEDFDICGNN